MSTVTWIAPVAVMNLQWVQQPGCNTLHFRASILPTATTWMRPAIERLGSRQAVLARDRLRRGDAGRDCDEGDDRQCRVRVRVLEQPVEGCSDEGKDKEAGWTRSAKTPNREDPEFATNIPTVLAASLVTIASRQCLSLRGRRPGCSIGSLIPSLSIQTDDKQP